MSAAQHVLKSDTAGHKRFRAGTHRVVSPAETVERVRELMPAMGITRIANVTGLDTIGIPVVMVCRPNARTLAVAQGKGIDLPAAVASGLMESVEFHHAEYVDLPLKLASYEEMQASQPVIDVAGLARLPETHFRPSLPLLWVEGYDLLQRSAKWLPYDTVHANFTVDVPNIVRTFIPSSNGLASGNTLEEAISQGIAEVVERDAATLFGLSGKAHQDGRRVDLATVDDPLCRELLATFDRADIDVGIWDMTSDVGIPTFRCFITARRPNPVHPLPNAGGFGCHPSRPVALMRALTEAAQSRLTFISGARDDMFRDMYEHAFNPGAIAAGRSWVHDPPRRDFREAPTWESETLQDDISWELERLRSRGITEAVAVDLTKPELRLPVVKVVVPGLEFVDGSSHRGAHYRYGGRARRVIERREMEEAVAVFSIFASPRPPQPSSAPDIPVMGPRTGTAPTIQTARLDGVPHPQGVEIQLRHLVEVGHRPEIAIFTGPSLSPAEASQYLDAVYLPPVSEGDVYRVALLRPRAIGIIDGFFERVPAVWHKEILWAMSQGIHVFGAASMGALRAAELAAYGMAGTGEIFAAYREGTLEDDDEVAVLHAPAEMEYRALSDAMVDIRVTLRQAAAEGVIADSTCTALEVAAKRLHYSQRTYQRMLEEVAPGEVPDPELESLRAWLPKGRIQGKRADAITLLQTMRQWLAADPGPKRVPWTFQQTLVWHAAQERAGHFVHREAEVGALRTDALLEELRVDPRRYVSVLHAAMLRLLAEREAARLGSVPGNEMNQDVARAWQAQHGLKNPAEVDAWLAAQNLTSERLAEILGPEVALRCIGPSMRTKVVPYMLDQLRLTGDYSLLLARAQHKQEILTSIGLGNPTPAQAGLSNSQLLTWYFAGRLDQPAPSDLEAYARDLGYVDSQDLLRAVLREYCYLQRDA